MKNCKCGKCNWEWQMDDKLRSWITCADCGDNMFDKGVGVILINWHLTDINDINIEDVLRSNVHNNGIVNEKEQE